MFICVFVYLCIYIQVSTCSTCKWHNSPSMMLLSRKSAAGETQDCFWSSSFLFYYFFFLKYVVKKNATFNSTAVLSFGRSCCQHRRVNSSKTWSVLLKLMTYGILHLQWNISHTRLRGSGCLPITFAQQLNIAMGKTYHDWIKMFVIPYE